MGEVSAGQETNCWGKKACPGKDRWILQSKRSQDFEASQHSVACKTQVAKISTEIKQITHQLSFEFDQNECLKCNLLGDIDGI